MRLIFMVQTGEGKRKAMADGLRELARYNPPADSVVALMPQKMGWFVWYCLVDQRISFWTTLITPGSFRIINAQNSPQ